MAATTIEDVYCKHIRPRSRAERLRLIELASKDLAAEESVQEPAVEPKKQRSLLELRGLVAQYFPKMDAQEHIYQLRAEWDDRP